MQITSLPWTTLVAATAPLANVPVTYILIFFVPVDHPLPTALGLRRSVNHLQLLVLLRVLSGVKFGDSVGRVRNVGR